MTLLPLLLSSVLWAQNISALNPPIASLCRSYNETTDPAEKIKLITQIAQTPPTSSVDVQYEFTLFMRYSDFSVQAAVLRSLSLMHGPDSDIATPFVDYLSDPPDPRALIFAIEGAYQLRSKRALPLIKKIAKSRFKAPSLDKLIFPKEKNLWRAHYSALDALALWEGKKVIPLLVDKAFEAPVVAHILAVRFWPQTLPLIVKWSSGSLKKQNIAKEALSVEVPRSALKETYPQMLEIVNNPKSPKSLRDKIAISLGIAASENQITDLIKEYQSLKPNSTKRLFIEEALFASRSRQVIPILMDYAKNNPDPSRRANARKELKELMGPAEYRDFLRWVAHNDPDDENRVAAKQELKQSQ